MESIIEFLDSIAFTTWGQSVTWRSILSFLIFQAILLTLYQWIFVPVIRYYFDAKMLDSERKKGIKRKFAYIYAGFALYGTVKLLGYDFNLLNGTPYSLFISTIITLVLLVLFAQLFDYLFNKVFLSDYYKNREVSTKTTTKEESKRSPSSSIQITAYLIIIIWGLNYFNLDFKIFPSITTNTGDINFFLSSILFGVLIILVAQLLGWVITQLILFTYYKRKDIDVGTQFAINQLIKYVIYVVSFLIAIGTFGIEQTVLWGGAAALLVGVGLGLQQTFNDLISGIILLFERSVEVGDVIEIDSMVGIVRKIGLRTSRVETRDSINVIVPNSKLIVNNMINWSHYDDKARFLLSIGVAYGSDTKKVRQLLIEVAKQNPYVLDYPPPTVLFSDFADSSLNFTLTFWTRNFLLIEAVKSELRFEIDQLFREHDISIPFPQTDIWVKQLPGNGDG